MTKTSLADLGYIKMYAKNLEQDFNTMRILELIDSIVNREKNLIIIQHRETKELLAMTLNEILEEINRDRSDEWENYNENDWQEGLDNFTEYILIGEL
jgi:hypoxanthine phosphoribosyltransferase